MTLMHSQLHFIFCLYTWFQILYYYINGTCVPLNARDCGVLQQFVINFWSPVLLLFLPVIAESDADAHFADLMFNHCRSEIGYP